jgi:23S rRNA (cytosine1962-C5)-methyltransferase
MIVANHWKDYELLDAGDGEKLERWGSFYLRRPDPQALWPKDDSVKQWDKVDAVYHRSNSGGGNWTYKKQLPENWKISYENLKFYVQPTGFKHTGIFPEQGVNWEFIIKKIKGAQRPIKVLNLFAYTGGATLASAYAGADVCHVDASKGMVLRAKENIEISGLSDRKVRLITDDVFKFVEREIRRGNQYDVIIMDPPSYGRGPKGEIWKIEEKLFGLIELCMSVLSQKPLFFQINSYTTGFSPTVIENMLSLKMPKNLKGKLSSGEVGLRATQREIILPCGIYARWEEIL